MVLSLSSCFISSILCEVSPGVPWSSLILSSLCRRYKCIARQILIPWLSRRSFPFRLIVCCISRRTNLPRQCSRHRWCPTVAAAQPRRGTPGDVAYSSNSDSSSRSVGSRGPQPPAAAVAEPPPMSQEKQVALYKSTAAKAFGGSGLWLHRHGGSKRH